MRIYMLFLLLSASVLGAEPKPVTPPSEPSFSAQDQQRIRIFYAEKQHKAALYNKYHPGDNNSKKPPQPLCPTERKKGDVVALDFMAQAQVLPNDLASQLSQPKGTLTLIRGRCVFRINEENRTMIDQVSVME